MERIFCLEQQPGPDWGVSSLLRSSSPREYTAVAQLLGSKGALLTAAGRLVTGEPYLRLSLPLARLHPGVTLEQAQLSPFMQQHLTQSASP